MNSEEKINLNMSLQSDLEALDVDALYFNTASSLHEIWRETRVIKDENGSPILVDGHKQYEDRWKKLDPSENEREAKYVEDKLNHKEEIMTNPKFANLIKIDENNQVSINISQMNFKMLSPHWQQENMDAAVVAVNFALDNYLYLSDERYKDVAIEMLGSAIHALWLSRPANSYARETELGKRFGLISREEQLKDNRHMVIAKNLVDSMILDKKLNRVIDASKKVNDSVKR